VSKSKLCRSAILLALLLSPAFNLGQQASQRVHSWQVFMNTPGAKEAAAKLLGHCGDASTQDVMNACFAMEFKNADQKMNAVYQATLKQLSHEDQQRVRTVQRAWLQYRELHCQTVGALQAGGGSLEPTEIFSCKTDSTKARTKEIQTSYGSPEDSKQD
jgi:uncharacterized protein YecT (DUF1311 family)